MKTKAILILDMPNGCDDCDLRCYIEELDIYRCCLTGRQADWLIGREEKCPLKFLTHDTLKEIDVELYKKELIAEVKNESDDID